MTALVIFLNAKWFITSGDDSYTHLDTYVSAGDSKKKISGTALKHLDEVPGADTDEFYRSTNLVTTGNLRSSSLLYGYNDVSTFSSTLNGGIVNYNNAMGNCRWNIVSIYDYKFHMAIKRCRRQRINIILFMRINIPCHLGILTIK